MSVSAVGRIRGRVRRRSCSEGVLGHGKVAETTVCNSLARISSRSLAQSWDLAMETGMMCVVGASKTWFCSSALERMSAKEWAMKM